MTTQTQLSTFNFENSAIRVIAINGEPWFIAKDVCEATGISNYRDAIERLDDDEKGVALTDTLGGKQEMNIISESGMYTLILRCREAVKKGSVPHRFRKWVTAEVLPQIRKTGSYTKPVEQEPKFTHTLTSDELRDLAWLWFEASKMAETMNTLYQPLATIGSNLAPMVYSQGVEYGNHIQRMGKLIYRLTYGVDFSSNPTPFRHLQGITASLVKC
ncbi:TPA: BRO family protein [Mannheimia haemolytica]